MSETINIMFDENGLAKEYDDTFDITIHCESEEAHNKVLEILNRRWIPVSERLPKAGEYVEGVAKFYLVQNKYEDMLVARYTHSEYWEQIYQLKPIEDEIVAWMPLPEPYKESEVKD